MDSIKAVIFDYAGVISLHQPEADVRRMEELSGVSGARFLEAYWGCREPYDRGTQDGPAYWRAFAQAAGCTLQPGQIQALIEADTASWIHLHPVMVGWLRRLHEAGVRTAILSNLGVELRQHLEQHYDWIRRCAHRTFSCEVHLVKPEPGIYRHAVEGLGVKPAEALFIDDRVVNVRAAEALGIRAVHFTTPEALAEQLRELSLPGLLPVAA
jgi:putative hydrolase of the HAD superfamily